MARSSRGFVSIEVGLVLPAFLVLVVFVFEIMRYFFVNVQLLEVLEQVGWQSKLGVNRDIEENAKALASGFSVPLIDPEKLQARSFSADSASGIAASTNAGTGGADDVVRYELRYEYTFLGNVGDWALEPISLEFVDIRRNEPVFR